MAEADREALNKRLLKFAGFKRISKPYAKEMGMQAWKYPDGEWDLERDLPNFPEDETACFKWLVPNVIDKIMSEQECSSDLAYAILFKKWLQELQLNIPYHALTLCQVISGLIDEKDKTSC